LDSTKRIELIKSIILDQDNGDKKTWEEYGRIYETGGENCRALYRRFKNQHVHKNMWIPGYAIEEDWKSIVHRVISDDPLLKDIPEGTILKGAHQQQTKDGDVVWLKSVQAVQGLDPFKKVMDEAVVRFEQIINSAQILPVTPPPVNKNNKTLQIIKADSHVGSLTNNSLFGNNYNSRIFDERMNSIIHTIMELVDRYGSFDHIDIVDLGDGVDGYNGQTARGGHALEQELSADEQFEKYVSSHCFLFDNLVREELGDKLAFIACCNDNHPGVSFSYPCNRAVELYLNAKYPSVETKISKDFLFHTKRGKHVCLWTHGKDDKYMKNGFPIKLDNKSETFIEAYIEYNNLCQHIPFNKQKFFIHLDKGDLHQSAAEYAKRFEYTNHPSLMGQTNFIEYNYSLGYGYSGFSWRVIHHDQAKVDKGIVVF